MYKIVNKKIKPIPQLFISYKKVMRICRNALIGHRIYVTESREQRVSGNSDAPFLKPRNSDSVYLIYKININGYKIGETVGQQRVWAFRQTTESRGSNMMIPRGYLKEQASIQLFDLEKEIKDPGYICFPVGSSGSYTPGQIEIGKLFCRKR